MWQISLKTTNYNSFYLSPLCIYILSIAAMAVFALYYELSTMHDP